ncbi:MAG: D-sedoheptulose-7-phosphate isomerase [Elusimicrobiales bacterium]
MDLEKNLKEAKEIFDQISLKREKIYEICSLILNALKNGNKILICGNGGSASQSQHFAAEIVGRYQRERKGFCAISLASDISVISSVSNDYSYEVVFARQVEAIGRKGDVLIGLSTSGNSKNVINAFKIAKTYGIKTIGILGRKGKIAKLSDTFIDFEAPTPRVQEAHLFVIHTICEFLEENI